jgi:hypothetical protein
LVNRISTQPSTNRALLLIKKLDQQHPYTIDQGNGKNAFSCLVPGGVDVIGKKRNVAYQAPDTKKGDQPVFPEKHPDELWERVTGKTGEINDDENYQWGNEAKNQSHLQVILL